MQKASGGRAPSMAQAHELPVFSIHINLYVARSSLVTLSSSVWGPPPGFSRHRSFQIANSVSLCQM